MTTLRVSKAELPSEVRERMIRQFAHMAVANPEKLTRLDELAELLR